MLLNAGASATRTPTADLRGEDAEVGAELLGEALAGGDLLDDRGEKAEHGESAIDHLEAPTPQTRVPAAA